ncbi:MAG: DUF63 family protein [Candidatus Aenigmarchaeota archaeon]|nr:DUF63 family protein [Candidatus Aenigmarchaeota archaeon]
MADFFTEFFVNPILLNGWFNPVNTLLWGLILVVAAFLVYSKLLKRMKILVDKHFTLAIIPFIFWASSTRVLRDLFYGMSQQASGNSQQFMTDIVYQIGLIQQQAFSYISRFVPIPPIAGFFSWIVTLFPTPGSYVFTFIFALACLFIGLGIQRIWKVQYWKIMFVIGFVACILNVWMLPFTNPWGMGMILGITGAFAAVFFGFTYIQERFKSKVTKSPSFQWLKLFSRPNSSLLSAHMLDSSATFVSVMFFGYLEQHPVPRLFIESVGPWTFFVLKLAVLLPSLYIIDKYAEDGDFKNFLKIVILILGLAPGLRDTIRLAAGV